MLCPNLFFLLLILCDHVECHVVLGSWFDFDFWDAELFFFDDVFIFSSFPAVLMRVLVEGLLQVPCDLAEAGAVGGLHRVTAAKHPERRI